MGKKTKSVRLINKFIKIFVISFIIFTIVAAAATFGYVKIVSNSIMDKLKQSAMVVSEKSDEDNRLIEKEKVSSLKEKKITTMAVFGVDVAGYRTDVIMLAFFHHDSGDIDIISVPRDTKVKIPDDIFAGISKKRSDVKQYSRINNIPAYVNKEDRNTISVKVLEEVFKVKVDYYVNIDLAGFKNIVDSVQPLYVDVPRDMNYSDLSQEPPIVINLKKGMQQLNGAQAEQLIRFRSGYANADIGRIETQHIFMKAFADKVLEPGLRFNAINLIKTALTQVDTNFEDALDYVIYLDKIAPDRIFMYTIPGDGNRHDGSYEYDVEQTKQLFESVLNKQPKAEQTADAGATNPPTNEKVVEVEPTPPVDLTQFKISVQNAAGIEKLASKTKEKLTKADFNVVDASNYKERNLSRTKIFSHNREVAEAVANYFKHPEITIVERSDAIFEQYDVIVAVGKDDATD